jgi:DNA-binding SARP family transcriptional activator/DNA-binding beta-propeller fold protein YncE
VEGGRETRFRVLGPLEVEQENRLLTLGGARQRALLAALVLHANQVVPRDRLVEAVWGEDPPESAPSALQGYVSALRKALGPDVIVTRPPGYELEADSELIDVLRFEALAAAGAQALASGDAARAEGLLREALRLWRGEPLADLESVRFVELERLRLEEVRLGALADRNDARLALGGHTEVAGELAALVHEHPLRERFRAQLMLALYRAGRQAEALEVYQQGRALLSAELGLEPGEPLKELERAILRHDEALAPPAPPRRSRPPGARKRGYRRVALFAGAAAVAAAAVAELPILPTRGAPSSLPVAANSVAVVDTAANRVVGDIRIDGSPVAIAAGRAGVYVASEREGIVWRIDPKTRRVVDKIGVGADVHDIAVGFGSVWLADGTDGTVTRLDERLSSIERRIPLGPGQPDSPAFWIATNGSSVWVTHGEAVVQIDPATNRVVRRVATPWPSGVAAGLNSAWVASGSRLIRVGPKKFLGSLPREGPLPAAVVAPTVGGGAVWSIVYNGLGELWRIAPTGAAAVVGGLGRFPLDVAVGDGDVWTIDTRGIVTRIDGERMRPEKRIATAPTLRSALATTRGFLWVTVERPT